MRHAYTMRSTRPDGSIVDAEFADDVSTAYTVAYRMMKSFVAVRVTLHHLSHPMNIWDKPDWSPRQWQVELMNGCHGRSCTHQVTS